MYSLQSANGVLESLYHQDGEVTYRLVKYHGKTRLMYNDHETKEVCIAYIYSDRLTPEEVIDILLGKVLVHQYTLANSL